MSFVCHFIMVIRTVPSFINSSRSSRSTLQSSFENVLGIFIVTQVGGKCDGLGHSACTTLASWSQPETQGWESISRTDLAQLELRVTNLYPRSYRRWIGCSPKHGQSPKSSQWDRWTRRDPSQYSVAQSTRVRKRRSGLGNKWKHRDQGTYASRLVWLTFDYKNEK